MYGGHAGSWVVHVQFELVGGAIVSRLPDLGAQMFPPARTWHSISLEHPWYKMGLGRRGVLLFVGRRPRTFMRARLS